MFRYIALVWDDAQGRADAAAARLSARLVTPWQCAVRRPGLVVVHDGARPGSSQPHPLDGGAGTVLGRLFKGDAAAPPAFDARETCRLLATGGRHLIEHYWGRYVAFLHDADSSTTRVMRDPCAGMPCLHVGHEGVEVYFSRMEDALSLQLGPFTIRWDYIAAQLCYQVLELRETALNEVSRLLGGECAEHCHGLTMHRFHWTVLQAAGAPPVEDAAEAAANLRQTLHRCVQAWAAGHSSIVHALSGGLDSSIVMSCLQDAPHRPDLICFNYYSPGANSDERRFARLMAARADCELIERERDTALRFETLLQVSPLAYPVNCRYYLENSRWEAELAAARGATALFCGEGGDQMFYQSRALFAAGDYLCRRGVLRGLRPECLRVALDAARLDRVSIWRVFQDALGQYLLGRRWQVKGDVARYKQLIPAQVVAAVKADVRFLHPHFRAPAHALPSGKLWHAYQLAFPAMNFYDPLDLIRAAERIAPIASQPVLELCLRIPVDVLTTGGWERAIARRAFRHDLPQEIVTRRTKGGLDEFGKCVQTRNLAFLREFLLDGQLVAQGLVERARLQEALSGRPTRVGANLVEIFDLANAEAWARHWV